MNKSCFVGIFILFCIQKYNATTFRLRRINNMRLQNEQRQNPNFWRQAVEKKKIAISDVLRNVESTFCLRLLHDKRPIRPHQIVSMLMWWLAMLGGVLKDFLAFDFWLCTCWCSSKHMLQCALWWTEQDSAGGPLLPSRLFLPSVKKKMDGLSIKPKVSCTRLGYFDWL